MIYQGACEHNFFKVQIITNNKPQENKNQWQSGILTLAFPYVKEQVHLINLTGPQLLKYFPLVWINVLLTFLAKWCVYQGSIHIFQDNLGVPNPTHINSYYLWYPYTKWFGVLIATETKVSPTFVREHRCYTNPIFASSKNSTPWTNWDQRE